MAAGERGEHGGAWATARADDPPAEAWAAVLWALLCRRGVAQMRADADEAARRFATENLMAPAPALMQGLARVLSGDLDRGDVCFQDAVSIGEEAGASEVLPITLCER